MSFDHSHFADDETAPDQLPAEFAALGEQLQADAERLGKTYPSCQPPLALMETLEQRASRQRQIRWWVMGVASSAALVLVAAGLYGLRTFANNGLTKEAVAAVAAHSVDVAASEAAVAGSPVVSAPTLPKVTVQPVSYRPALAEVNGPELEGLLDLMDEQRQQAAVIAF